MTEAVVEVGPATIRGPNDARPELVSTALECIDDNLALLDDRPVSVPSLWRDVIWTTAGRDAESMVLVCPTWWPRARVERVRAAALTVTSTVMVLDRTPLLRDGATDRRATVVEITEDFVVVSRLGAAAVVVPRRSDPVADAETVVSAVGASTAVVVVDAPVGVEAERLGTTIADRVRANGLTVEFAGEDSVRCAAAARRAGDGQSTDVAVQRRVSRSRRGAAVLAGALSAALLCGGFAMRVGASDSPTDDMQMTLLAEGRVGVMVPSHWRVQRITSGPGSARVQIVSPTDTDIAIHLAQSIAVPGSSLAATADSLRAALDAEPDGEFVDFNPAGRRAGRPAVTYREIRPEHHVGWVVLVDGAVRIAIGCQSAPGREHLVGNVCDRAVRSAHAIF